MRPLVNELLCVACGTCEGVCPADPNVFEVTDVARVVNPQACLGCGACVESCPEECIELVDD